MRYDVLQPERIDGENKDKYDVRSDVWSLAISLIEIATGNHTYARWKTPFEQLKQVVHEPAPHLPLNDMWSSAFHDFINKW